ncbi:MAG TPA: hypothetical protein VJ843_06045 [Candidatus Saccharimonadales bacterium]|nr:hypothetical protein [Candidatus Saccharimonadales bacterium]
MKKALARISLLVVAVTICAGIIPAMHTQAAMNNNNIIDDFVFNDTSTMTAADINNFLNGFASSCISPNNGFLAIDPTGYSPSTGYKYGGNVTAGQVIYDAAQAYGINPRVLLTTLQKEQSLVTGTAGCSVKRYAAAVGYGCPDSGGSYGYSGVNLYTINGTTVTSIDSTCVNSSSKVGFSQQVIRAAWLLKFGQQRSEGNVGWAVIKGNWDNSDDPQSCYSGPMTQGTFQRCPSGSTTYYDGYTTIDGTPVHMDNGSTAALYWYTPHFSGNQHFYDIFTGWFGSTQSGRCTTNQTNVSTTVSFYKVDRNKDAGVFLINSGSGSGCVEAHIWNDGFKSWRSHIATNQASINYPYSQVLFGDLDGTGLDYPVLFGLSGTGSGQVEAHVWNRDMKSWITHAPSNLAAIDPTDDQIALADLNGDGKDEAIVVEYQNTGSNMIEFHGWGSGLQSWLYHDITNRGTISPLQNIVKFADPNGTGKDEAILVSYANTGSGMVEFHEWNPGEKSWKSHIVSNLPQLATPADYQIEFADLNGDGKDEAILVSLRHTGSGMIEFHVWNPGFTSWKEHIISNQPEIQ